MAFPTSISLILMATICCIMANAIGEKQLPSVIPNFRQSKQMYVVSPQLYNYYNPYDGTQVLTPAAQGEEEDSEVTGRQSSEDINITPVATECTSDKVADNGYGGCTKGSSAKSGNIIAKFTKKGQVVAVALVPSVRYSTVKITCSDVTKALIYTKTGKILATADSPIKESKNTQVVIVADDDASTVKCSWEAS